jgi:hypothetical protein
MDGFKIDASDFLRATAAINERAQKNTLRFAESAASEFERSAKTGAPWVDRSGTARKSLYGRADQSGNRTRIEMGGSAPNKNKTSSAYPDYLEILEFGHNSLKKDFPDLSILYPTRDALAEGIRQQYGDAVLRGMTGFKIPRSKAAMRVRARNFRNRQR